MIKVFRANDTNYSTNGELILKPIDAIITKNIEEEYVEIDAPLKYIDVLVQDNVLIIDTLTGRKGYRIFNPIVSNLISIKAWLCYQESSSVSADRGVVISHSKNLENCKITESWDDVVTKLIPFGYNSILLPEVSISVSHSYQKDYEKTIEFELTESLEKEVAILEDTIDLNTTLKASLENSITILQAKYKAYTSTSTDLTSEKAYLQNRLQELGTSEAELKEKAVIEAQIPLINKQLTEIIDDKASTLAIIDSTKVDLLKAQDDIATATATYNNTIITDLRTQAQAYININRYPQINYDLEAHLEGILELGDTVRVRHPAMRVDLLTNVSLYKFDCITSKFRQVEFGTAKATLKGKITEIEDEIEAAKETIVKVGNSVTKYSSDYKRDNKEMVSSFASELYGNVDGIYGMIEKNNSVFRQTASEISGTVSRVNVDLSTDIASLVIKADSITSTVASNYDVLDGKITSNTSSITQTATQIRSEVTAKFTGYSTTTQMTSAITQSANSITSSVTTQINGIETNLSTVEQTADKISWLVKSGSSASTFLLTDRAISQVAETINLTGYVTFNSLSTAGSTAINGGNITTGTLDASKITVTNLNINNVLYGTYPVVTCTGTTGNPTIYIGKGQSSNTVRPSDINIVGTSINIGDQVSSLYDINLKAGTINFSAGTTQKKTLANISTASAATTIATALNALQDVMRSYGLIG